MTAVRMLVSAEGEYSLSAGRDYELPEPLAGSLIDAGYAEPAEKGAKVETPAVNVQAPHHRNDYEEFTPGAVHGEEPAETPAATEEAKPKPKRKPRAKKTA